MPINVATIPLEKLARVGEWLIRPGCILAEAPTRGGKTTTLVSLVRALEAPTEKETKQEDRMCVRMAASEVNYVSLDEAYATAYGLKMLSDPTASVVATPPLSIFNDYITMFAEMLKPNSILVLDSVMTFFAVASGLVEQPAMSGGYLSGYGIAAMRLNQLAAARKACVIAVLNKDAFPLQSFEFAVDGVMKIHSMGNFTIIARTNQRKPINVNLKPEILEAGLALLGFSAEDRKKKKETTPTQGISL